MARKLLVHWDAGIDGAFRRRLERAFGSLQIDYADAAGVDEDPDGPAPVRLAVVSPSGNAPKIETDLLIVGGPGDARTSSQALRLDTDDIDARTRRWLQAADRLGQKLGRPGLATFAELDGDPGALKSTALAFPADPLARELGFEQTPGVLYDKLADLTRRAEAAEDAIARAKLDESSAIRDMERAKTTAAALAARIAELEQRNEQLEADLESSAYALDKAPPSRRAVIQLARDHAWRGRIAAARAASAGEAHPNALAWPKSHASYSGETLNGQPHGHGVMTFSDGKRDISIYRGAFDHGRRSGHGHAHSDGCTWTGQWSNDEPNGLGRLETPDGRRYEGAVVAARDGSPVADHDNGHEWPHASRRAIHQPVPQLIAAD